MNKIINLWDRVSELNYGQLDGISEALHRAIYLLAVKEGLTEEETLTMQFLTANYKLVSGIFDKHFPGSKYAQQIVKDAVAKYQG